MAVRSPTVLSICSGAGGLDLGVKLARPDARVVCYVEREAFAVANLVAAMEAGFLDEAPIWSDLRTFRGRPWRGKVDWLVGGIPCQPHSTAGQRQGASDERDLWPDAARIIGEVRPGVVFLENVPGIARYYHERIGPELQGMGYATQEGLFSAEEVGAPHVRQRFFVLGYAERAERWSNGRSRGTQRADLHPQRQEGAGLLGVGDEELTQANDSTGSTEQAVADGLGRQGIRWPEQGVPVEELGSVFPPSPDDLEAWAYLLAEMPEIEPAFCREAAGVAWWLDATAARPHRLRVLGNGVVPLVVAHAFRTLAARVKR